MSGVQAAVDGLFEAAEFIAFDQAIIAFDLVKNDTSLVDLAKSVLDLAENCTEQIANATKVIVEVLAGHFGIIKIELHGNLREIIVEKKPCSAYIEGILGVQPVTFWVTFGIGTVIDFLRLVFEKFVEHAQDVILGIFRRLYLDGFGRDMAMVSDLTSI